MNRVLPAAVFACLLSAIVPACRCGTAGRAEVPAEEASALDATTVLAEIPARADDPPRRRNRFPLHVAADEVPREFVFASRGGGVAFVVEEAEGFRVVHNGRTSRPYEAVGRPALSRDGRRCAHGGLSAGEWRMVVDGREGEGFDAVKAPAFSADGEHVAYQALRGERWLLVVDGVVVAETGTRFGAHVLAPDGRRAAWVEDLDERWAGRLVVGETASRARTVIGEKVTGIVADGRGSRVAAVAIRAEGKAVVSASTEGAAAMEVSPSADEVGELAFGKEGLSVAYEGVRRGERYLAWSGREEALGAGAALVAPPVVMPGGGGVGALVASARGVELREFFTKDEAGGLSYQAAEGLAYGPGGRSHAFAASRGGSWFVVVDGKEGPSFDRVVTPVFSPDGEKVVYRARSGGARFVVVADLDGETIRRHPGFEQVFPVRFTRDGRSVAYGVKDGRRLVWRVEAL